MREEPQPDARPGLPAGQGLAELMGSGPFAAPPPPRPSDRRRAVPRQPPGPRRIERRIAVLLGLDLALIACVAALPPAGTPEPRLRGSAFAVHAQDLYLQALAQAEAGRFDAAIADLERHLALHPELGPVERELTLRALALFAARAGRPEEAARHELALPGAAAARQRLAPLLEAAERAERDGRPEAMQALLARVLADAAAPPSLRIRAAEALLRAGNGEPVEPTIDGPGR